MKGPRPRECSPTHACPDLKATAVFQDGYPFLVASEESLEEVGREIGAYARRGLDGSGSRIGGLDGERWREGKIEMER